MVLSISGDEIKRSFIQYKGMFQNLARQYGGKLNDDFDSIVWSLDTVRTLGKNESTGAYACKANLVASAYDSSSSIEIGYTSEIANENDFYVEVQGLTEEAQGELISVLITQ